MLRKSLALTLGVCVLLFPLSACSSKISQVLPEVRTLQTAKRYFGEPARVEQLPDGGVQHEWLLDQTEFEPGRYVTEQIFIGHDRDGYRKYREREVWVPAHRKGKYCRLLIVVDAQGRVLNSSWQGNACDSLFLQTVSQ